VTWTEVDIILLELAQEPNHGENVLLDLKPELQKEIFENRIRIFL
jgi:hypothetical protein